MKKRWRLHHAILFGAALFVFPAVVRSRMRLVGGMCKEALAQCVDTTTRESHARCVMK